MATALFQRFVDKSHEAMVSAIEIYNRPTFAYRDETFCILAINAWELLLKAKLLKENKNDPKCIQVREPRKLKGGGKSTKQFTVKKNRAGNPMTLQLSACISLLEKLRTPINPQVNHNLQSLIEIRDNATHFVIPSTLLQHHVLELACANVRNFVVITKSWFEKDFSDSLSLVLPVAFFRGGDEMGSVIVTKDEKRLLDHLHKLAETQADGDFTVAARLDIRLHRSTLDTGANVQITRDPDALAIRLDEDQLMDRFPWNYEELCVQLKRRMPNIKFNKEFHEIRKSLSGDPSLVHSRLLDPNNPKGSKKNFYSHNMRDRIIDAYDDTL